MYTNFLTQLGNGGTASMFPKFPAKGYFSRNKVRLVVHKKAARIDFTHTDLGEGGGGVLSEGGTMHTRTLNNAEWGGGITTQAFNYIGGFEPQR